VQDTELLRYSRHVLLSSIGIEGQHKIFNARILIVGVGGLGSPAAMYLAGAGVGHIDLVDNDIVEMSNLQRQIAHRTSSIGLSKVESAAQTLTDINPLVTVSTFNARADSHFLAAHLPKVDMVLDCCDNFETRHAVNAACVRFRKPLISAGVIQTDGQVTVYAPHTGAYPCYACIFPADDPPPLAVCATMGVFSPLVGIIGSMQAAEALKIVCNLGRTLTGRLLLLDGMSMEWSELQVSKNPLCCVCGSPD
jgi:molybdopterin/thiamine biosynthesis adenylyltransferase